MPKRKIWNNQWIESIPVNDDEYLTHSPLGDNGDVYLAIEAAKNAYPASFLSRYLISARNCR
jgi:hypothetical protein